MDVQRACCNPQLLAGSEVRAPNEVILGWTVALVASDAELVRHLKAEGGIEVKSEPKHVKPHAEVCRRSGDADDHARRKGRRAHAKTLMQAFSTKSDISSWLQTFGCSSGALLRVES